MKVSKQKSIRMKNAPLKGARAIGSNMTEVEHGDLTVLYSYETPVAFLSPNGGYRTEKQWSKTTSTHIGKFFGRHGYDLKGAFKLSQDDLERFVSEGAVPSEGRISGDPRTNPRVSVGQRLQVAEGSGLESGRLGIVIKVLPRGVRSPGGLGGHSRPHSVAILRDANGDTFEMFTSHLGEPGKVSFREPWPRERDFPINVDPTPAESREVVRRLTRRDNPAGQLWYPGGVAVGRYRMGEAGVRYYVIPVESTHGWDFPTLSGMFPDNLRPDALALVEARLGYEHSGQEGYHLFKVRVNGKWSRPLRLRTSLTELPGVK